MYNWKSVINFPQLANLVFPFWFTVNASPYQRDIIVASYVFAYTTTHVRYRFLLCFYFVFTLVLTSGHTPADVFSIVVQIFRRLFWKICPLFGQILIKCLKCSRALFSPSSCSEKMRWGRGWESMEKLSKQLVFTITHIWLTC